MQAQLAQATSDMKAARGEAEWANVEAAWAEAAAANAEVERRTANSLGLNTLSHRATRG